MYEDLDHFRGDKYENNEELEIKLLNRYFFSPRYFENFFPPHILWKIV